MKRLYCSLLLFSAALSRLAAATGVSLVAADYSAPAAFEVAPGQVVTLHFRGVKPLPNGSLRSGRAETATLPTTIAGLSARLEQGLQPAPVPVFSVRQENQCGDTQPIHEACVLTSMRAQIPFELDLTPLSGVASVPLARLVLEVDGQPAEPVLLKPVAVNAHVLTSCDVDAASRAGACERMAFHADGARVTAAAPAKRGEVITVYAFGLGPTSPPVPSGVPSPSGADVFGSGVQRVWASIRNGPVNADPTAPRYFDAEAMGHLGPEVQFAGLTPGSVGLYQVNIQLPASFDIFLPCGGEIRSNAVALVTTVKGSEIVPFCVAP